MGSTATVVSCRVGEGVGRRGMDVPVTGATGYMGSGVVDALVAAGHRSTGLARSDGSARKLEERGILA